MKMICGKFFTNGGEFLKFIQEKKTNKVIGSNSLGSCKLKMKDG